MRGITDEQSQQGGRTDHRIMILGQAMTTIAETIDFDAIRADGRPCGCHRRRPRTAGPRGLVVSVPRRPQPIARPDPRPPALALLVLQGGGRRFRLAGSPRGARPGRGRAPARSVGGCRRRRPSSAARRDDSTSRPPAASPPGPRRPQSGTIPPGRPRSSGPSPRPRPSSGAPPAARPCPGSEAGAWSITRLRGSGWGSSARMSPRSRSRPSA